MYANGRPSSISQKILNPDLLNTSFIPRCSFRSHVDAYLDKKMNKADLRRATGVSAATIAKLDKGENVTTDILVRICKALDCELNDIMELSEDK